MTARSRLVEPLLALSAAVLWIVAHVVVHRARGWPMEVHGEWDLLLTALAIAAGDAPGAPIGTLHGTELGSYLVAACAAPLLGLGMAPVVAGKWVAAGFGGLGAGALAVLAHRIAGAGRSGVLAAVMTSLWVAWAWPGLHFELAGLSGRTPEALVPQLLAVLVLCRADVSGLRTDVSGLRAAVAGALLATACLLSPVALWSAAVVLGWIVLRAHGWANLRPVGAFAAGALAPFALFALFVPAGVEGIGLFLVEQTGLGVVQGPAGAPPSSRPGFGLLRLVARALEGGAHFPGLRLRDQALAALSWLALLGPVVALVRRGRGRAGNHAGTGRQQRGKALVSILALSWLLPLAALPLDRWFYPLAYRYWLVALGLGAAVAAAEIARGVVGAATNAGVRSTTRGLGLAVGTTWFVAVVVCALTLPTSILAPAPTRAEALVATGAHRLNPRPGHGRHDTYLAFAPHVMGDDAAALAEGYGLTLGGDLVVDLRDGREPTTTWNHPDLPSQGPVRAALLAGVGCGLTALGDVPDAARRLAETAAPGDRDVLMAALARCSGPPRPGAPTPPSTVADPASLMPPRW